MEEITRLIVEKLLSQPTEQLKNAGDPHLVSQYSEALNRLFALPAGSARSGDAASGDRDGGDT